MKQIILAVAAACALTGCDNKTQTSETEMTPADTLRLRLEAVADSGKVIFGHHDDPVYGHAWAWTDGRSDVLETAGDYPGVMSWDLGGIENGDTANLDGVPFDRMRREIVAQDRRGGINAFSWHLRNAVNNADSWDLSDTTIVHTMLTDTAASAHFDTMLARCADFFNSLRRPDGSKIPVVFRPWHEHTGSWFWWGYRLCTTDDYVALWHRTRQAFDRAGVDNVLWAYSPDRVADIEQYMERYPGDDYVDIMGLDIYHFGGEEGLDTYVSAVDRGLDIARTAADEHHKILAFSETGSESLPMAQWWTDVLLPLLRKGHPAYVVVWRNAWDKPTHYYAPFAGDHSAESFKKFYDDNLTVFATEMQQF